MNNMNFNTAVALNDVRRMLLIAVILNSALYLTGVFVAGLVTGRTHAWQLALLTIGVCYLSGWVQITLPHARLAATVLVTWSIVFGAAAGLLLL